MTSKLNLADSAPASASVSRPSLEDLLRLKRAERPDAAHWAEFERGMRKKQLAAIIEPRPWWLGLSLWGRKALPMALPLAAGVAAALAVVVLRESPGEAGLARGDVTEALAAQTTSVLVDPVLIESMVGADHAGTGFGVFEAVSALAAASTGLASASAVEVTDGVIDGNRVAAVELVAVEAEPEISPSAVLIEQTLQAITEEPLVALSGVGAVPATLPLLSKVSDPSDGLALAGRQERLLAMAEIDSVTSHADSLAMLRDRMVHRLDTDDRRLASASRVGLGMDRLSLRF